MSQPSKRNEILPIQSTSKSILTDQTKTITTTSIPQITSNNYDQTIIIPFHQDLSEGRLRINQEGEEGEGSSTLKRKTRNDDIFDKVNKRLGKRQDAAGYPSCLNQPNYVLSCYPTSSTLLTQDIWSKFIFNSQFPTFIGSTKVDIYLYHADSETIALSYLGIETGRGTIGIRPDELWWPVETNWVMGSNRTFPYFFVIVAANATLNGAEPHQATFSAVQTAPPATLLASIASVSLSSASVASSLSAHSSTSSTSLTPSSNPTSTSTSTLQPSNPNSSNLAIPGWSIALIVILGVLALVSGMVLLWFCIGGVRRRRNRDTQDFGEEGDGVGGARGRRGRNSVVGSQGSGGSEEPILRTTTTNGAVGTSSSNGNGNGNIGEKNEISNGGGGVVDNSNNPINLDSALLMAEAYRAELRKPTFHSSTITNTRHSSSSNAAEIVGGGGTSGGTGSDYSPHGSESSGPILDRKRSSGGFIGREIMKDSLEEEGHRISNVEGGGGKQWGTQGE